MNFKTNNHNRFIHYLKKTLGNYFSNKFRKFEFIFLMLLSVALAILVQQPFVSDEAKGIISTIESFIAIFLAFRFNYTGFWIAVLLNLPETIAVVVLYFKTGFLNYMIAATLKICTFLSSYIAAVLAFKQEIHENKLQQLAITDELTSVYNLRFFHSTLEEAMVKAKKDVGSVGLIFTDIDNFRMYNDVYGHDHGDKILKETANTLKESIKEGEILCRYGGDEFAIILTDTGKEKLQQSARRIRKDFESAKNSKNNIHTFNKVTLSFGMSEYPYTSSSKDELISQTDMALYHAKNSGKNDINFYKDVLLQIRKNVSSDNQQLIGIFKGLLSTISAKDKYTLGHCERVSSYAVMIAEAMNWDLKDITILQYAGLLHDIGKIELSKWILNKPGPLTQEEFNQIKMHPVYSANILEPLSEMNQLIEYVRHHHERFDGKGYPDGLAGDKISLGSRILCVADSFDAMLSERAYNKGIALEETVKELERCSGSQFDPEVVKIFTEIFKNKLLC